VGWRCCRQRAARTGRAGAPAAFRLSPFREGPRQQTEVGPEGQEPDPRRRRQQLAEVPLSHADVPLVGGHVPDLVHARSVQVTGRPSPRMPATASLTGARQHARDRAATESPEHDVRDATPPPHPIHRNTACP